MGQQLGLLYTAEDDVRLIQAIKSKYEILSVPRIFKENKGIAKVLGEYAKMNQRIFFAEDLNLIAKNIHQIKSSNWETMVETPTDDYHVYSNPSFYIDWNTTSVEKLESEEHKERYGKSYATAGRFYLSTPRTENDKHEKYEQLKKMFSFIVRQIKTSSLYISSDKKPIYVGSTMSELLLGSQVISSAEIIVNPLFRKHYR